MVDIKKNWKILVAIIAIGALSFFLWSQQRETISQTSNPEVAGISTMSITSPALSSVYITFAKFRYGKYATPSELYQGDMLYLKNFDRTKLRLLQIFLYDYQKRGNQEYTKSRVTSTSMYVRTRYKLPAGKRLAYVAKFQDIKTGEIATKYFLLALPLDRAKPWIVAFNCPSTTQNCIPCESGADCRYEPGKTYGFRGWACQNNNPGNIRNASTDMAADSKNKMIIRNGGTPACGVRSDSRGGSYFVFSTYEAGYGALKAYIKAINNGEHTSYAGTGWKCGNCTIAQFFSKYSGDGGDAYVNAVAASIGEETSVKLSYVVANKLTAFVDAIKEHEGFIVAK